MRRASSPGRLSAGGASSLRPARHHRDKLSARSRNQGLRALHACATCTRVAQPFRAGGANARSRGCARSTHGRVQFDLARVAWSFWPATARVTNGSACVFGSSASGEVHACGVNHGPPKCCIKHDYQRMHVLVRHVIIEEPVIQPPEHDEIFSARLPGTHGCVADWQSELLS